MKMQIETEKDLRINQLKLILFVMIVIFVAITSYTVYWLINYNKHYGFFVETKAEVVEQVNLEGTIHDVLFYEIEGNEYKVTSDIKSNNDLGDIITIYYDEDNPLGIIYSLDNKRIILPIITACFGVCCIALLVTYILIYVSNKKSKLATMQINKKTTNKAKKDK